MKISTILLSNIAIFTMRKFGSYSQKFVDIYWNENSKNQALRKITLMIVVLEEYIEKKNIFFLSKIDKRCVYVAVEKNVLWMKFKKLFKICGRK